MLTSDHRIEGLGPSIRCDGPDSQTVCLYSVDNGEIKAIGAAELNVSTSPWELKRAIAPGHGYRFFEMLIELSGENGIRPTTQGGEVTPRASGVFQKLYMAKQIEHRPVNGLHFERWLNCAYYSINPDQLSDVPLKNHERWIKQSRCRFLRWMNKLDIDDRGVLSSASTLLRKVADLYQRDEEGHMSIVRYAAKLLGAEYRRIGTPHISQLKAGSRLPGFKVDASPNCQWYLFDSLSTAQSHAALWGKKVEYKYFESATPIIHVDLHRLVEGNELLRSKVISRLGMNSAWQFIGLYWGIVSGELGEKRSAGFRDNSQIYFQEGALNPSSSS
jgi:hypothetical protein